MKNEKEDEKFSFWDYIEKRTLITIILLVALAISFAIIALYFRGNIRPDGVEPIEPHLHP